MIRLGEKQSLNVVRIKDFGVYIGEADQAILLPRKYVPRDIEVGDAIEVFVYRDSSDRLIATTEEPKVVLGQVAELTVPRLGT